MVSAVDSGSNGPGLSPGRGTTLCSWARHLTLTVLVFLIIWMVAGYLSKPDVRVAKNSRDVLLKKLPCEAKNISYIKISSHLFLLAKFYENLSNLHTQLIRSQLIHFTKSHTRDFSS